MFRKLKAICMAVIMTISLISGAVVFDKSADAAGEITVNLHYHRYAEDYDGWNVWSWVGPGAGSSYEFTGEDDFGMVAAYTIEVADGEDQIGFIVRHSTSSNEWDLKDCNMDRFIEVSRAKDGVIDIYLIQDEPNFGYGEEEMSLQPKIMEASLIDSKTINFKVSSEFDSTSKDMISKLTVKDSDGKEYAVSGISSEEGAAAMGASITMGEELPLFNKYTLAFEGYGEFAVSSTKVFSTKEFEDAFYYDGNDLGAVWSKDKTAFRVWAPTATEVLLNLYKAGVGTNLIESIPMKQDVKGTWVAKKTGDLNGTYYTYTVTVDGNTEEAVDPYARATGVNGDRGMVIDLDSTDPTGFTEDLRPPFVNPTDAILYELHIRDFSVDKSSGIKNNGKYLAFTETGTKNSSGSKTGIDYLVDLGVTHVHLLPSYDFSSVDETRLVNNQYNWGYDPENYNVPEGSYSTDPQHGEVRVNEFKQMVQSLHNNGIRVVMDVVYNHTAVSADSNFNKIVPGYYYRMTDSGQFSNSTGCGNETASERAMVRKFIVDSVVYWVTEYHVDGFRFDLMGVHDIETMNAVRAALNKIDPTILIYGEGWTASASTLPNSELALKANMSALDPNIAAFSDDIRDGIKGNVFTAADNGFVTGKLGMEDTIKFGIVASTQHDKIDYANINYSDAPWAAEPTQTINYASAHDNLALWDKIATTNGTDSEADRIKMNLLSSAIVLTSQGIPFFQAGEEILKSKPADETGTTFVDNSYQSPDLVNSIKWGREDTYKEVYQYYKGLIAFRKAHGALRMTKTSDIQANLHFLDGLDANVVGYTIDNSPNGESAEALCVIFNANREATTVTIPEGNWNVYVKGNKSGTKVLETVTGTEVTVEPISALVLALDNSSANTASETTVSEETSPEPAVDASAPAAAEAKNNNAIWFIAIGAGVIVLIAAAVAALVVKRRKKV